MGDLAQLCGTWKITGKEKTMNKLFEKSEINDMALPNRFVRAATFTGMATEEEGRCHPRTAQSPNAQCDTLSGNRLLINSSP